MSWVKNRYITSYIHMLFPLYWRAKRAFYSQKGASKKVGVHPWDFCAEASSGPATCAIRLLSKILRGTTSLVFNVCATLQRNRKNFEKNVILLTKSSVIFYRKFCKKIQFTYKIISNFFQNFFQLSLGIHYGDILKLF